MDYLLRSTAEDLSSIVEQAQNLGASEKMVAELKLKQQQSSEIFYLNHRNWPAFKAFLLVADCWQYSPNGYLQGFDYPKARLLWHLLKIRLNPNLIIKIRWIERFYLKSAEQFLK